MKHTTEEKKEYMTSLRNRWNQAKKLFTDGEAKAVDIIMAIHGMKYSRMGFFFCKLQMQQQNLDGIPYLDCKTFKGWIDNGFCVRKGEKSTVSGVSWVSVGSKGEEAKDLDNSYMFPKEYKLFHRSQVDAA